MKDDLKRYVLSKDVIRETVSGSRQVLRNSFTGMRLKVSLETIRLLTAFENRAMTRAEAAEYFQINDSQGINLLNELLDSLLESTILLPAEEALLFQQEKLQEQLTKNPFTLPRVTLGDCPGLQLINLKPKTIVIGGAPIDLGTTTLPGSRGGPDSLRESSVQFITYGKNFSSGDDNGWYNADTQSVILKNRRLADVGNIAVRPGEGLKELHQRCYQGAAEIFFRKCLPAFIGGDHSISAPLVKAYCDTIGGDVTIVQFDAHTDTAGWDSFVLSHHGNVISKILAENEKAKVIQYGIRGFSGQPLNNSRCVTFSQRQLLLGKDISEIIPKQKRCYITIDVDVLDPVFALGTGTPVPLGMYPHQLLNILYKVVEFNDVIGIDIVELNPLVDLNKTTSSLFFHILMCLLGWIDARG